MTPAPNAQTPSGGASKPLEGMHVLDFMRVLSGLYCTALWPGSEALYEAISNSAGSSWMFQNRVLHILAGNYQLNSAVDILVKDLGIVLDAGRKQKFSLPVVTAAHSIYRKASAKGAAVAQVFHIGCYANGRWALT